MANDNNADVETLHKYFKCMRNTKQISKELGLSRQHVAKWCLDNKMPMFRGKYVLNDLQVEMLKSRPNKYTKRATKLKREWDMDTPFGKVKVVDKTTDGYQNTKGFEFKYRKLDTPPKTDLKTADRIKKLELMLDLARLDLKREELQRKINN